MENKFSIKILYGINKIFPENSLIFENSTDVHVINGNVFVVDKAYGEDVTVWFREIGQVEIFRASLKELLKDRFNYKGILYDYNWYKGNPREGYRECVKELFPEKVNRN